MLKKDIFMKKCNYFTRNYKLNEILDSWIYNLFHIPNKIYAYKAWRVFLFSTNKYLLKYIRRNTYLLDQKMIVAGTQMRVLQKINFVARLTIIN